MKYSLIHGLLIMWYLLSANTTFAYTHADTLRGSNGRGRSWWDVQHYDLQISFDIEKKMITGKSTITFNITGTPTDSMQIDLQEPMQIESVDAEGKQLSFEREGNVWWIKIPQGTWAKYATHKVVVSFKGSPRKAVNPPWDGGISWTHDKNGKPWIAVSCQGLGASVWWPCKDAQWDEPEQGMELSFAALPGIQIVSNGTQVSGGDNSYTRWRVKSPINNYDATFYIGDYVHWQDTLMGEKGKLDLDFWVLRDNEEKARKQFAVVKPMLHCFEYWMGPYPFYEDGYKLVEAPYLGMEHQGAIAYGNNYQMGYRGFDRTLTGIGMNFDYIIVHESGHEWFGNNITAKDMADNWIHEGITTYSETLFAECLLGADKAKQYCRGEWHNIQNDKPIIGPYGVNEEGSNDMYDKGAAIMHMIRIMTNKDERFRDMLRGLGKGFYHQTVTTLQVENYIAAHTGLDLKAFFNQYLRTTDIPFLNYYLKEKELYYKFDNTVAGFTLPLTITAGGASETIHPSGDWQHIKWKGGYSVNFSKDFLIKTK